MSSRPPPHIGMQYTNLMADTMRDLSPASGPSRPNRHMSATSFDLGATPHQCCVSDAWHPPPAWTKTKRPGGQHTDTATKGHLDRRGRRHRKPVTIHALDRTPICPQGYPAQAQSAAAFTTMATNASSEHTPHAWRTALQTPQTRAIQRNGGGHASGRPAATARLPIPSRAIGSNRCGQRWAPRWALRPTAACQRSTPSQR